LLYSFRDVIALRTVAYLRDDLSLQRIRRAVNSLRELGESGHLSEYRLVVSGNSVTWVTGAEEGIDLVGRPGQRVLASMVDILGEFENQRGVVVPAFFNPRPLIAVDRATLGGYPVVAGTRVPFDLVAELVRDGISPDDLHNYYPGVSPEAARQALDYWSYVERGTRSAA